MWRWRCSFCYGVWMGLATRLVGAAIGDFSRSAASLCSAVSPFRWERRCTSFRSRRSGMPGVRWCSLRWEFSFLRRGRKNFFFAGAAKYAGAVVQERFGGMVDGFGSVRVFAHYKLGISQLALCDLGVDCGDFLWVDMAEDGVDFCLGNCARFGGCDVAFLVQDGMKRREPKARLARLLFLKLQRSGTGARFERIPM